MIALKVNCSGCQREIAKNSSENFKMDCSHTFCTICMMDMSRKPREGAKKQSLISIECTRCHKSTPFNESILPTINSSINLDDLSLLASDDEEFNCEPSPGKESKLQILHRLIASAEKKLSERILKRDADKIALVCKQLENENNDHFQKISTKLKNDANSIAVEAEKQMTGEIEQIHRGPDESQCSRKRAKISEVSQLQETVEKVSYFQMTLAEATALFQKAKELNAGISDANECQAPSFKMTLSAEDLLTSLSQYSLGSFDSNLALRTPSPVVQMTNLKNERSQPSPPVKPTPSPQEWAIEPIKALPKLVKAENMTSFETKYDSSLYSRMAAFKIVSAIDDSKRSLCRPVGCCAYNFDSKRQAAVVHTGHKVTLFSAGGSVVATYVLVDPDKQGRIQLPGDIAADMEGWIYLIDRDNLPSRILAFYPDRVAPADRNKVVPDVFARFTGRVRIYGLAVSSVKQILYTSNRTSILGFSLNSGQEVFRCDLRDPHSAYVHSLFEKTEPNYKNKSEGPFVVFTANEGHSIYKKALVGKGDLEKLSHIITSDRAPEAPIRLVRRTGCDPTGNILGADSGAKEVRVFQANGAPIARFSPPKSFGSAFSASGVAVIPGHADPKSCLDKCDQGKIHSGPVVVVTDFETHRILFFEALQN